MTVVMFAVWGLLRNHGSARSRNSSCLFAKRYDSLPMAGLYAASFHLWRSYEPSVLSHRRVSGLLRVRGWSLGGGVRDGSVCRLALEQTGFELIQAEQEHQPGDRHDSCQDDHIGSLPFEHS